MTWPHHRNCFHIPISRPYIRLSSSTAFYRTYSGSVCLPFLLGLDMIESLWVSEIVSKPMFRIIAWVSEIVLKSMLRILASGPGFVLKKLRHFEFFVDRIKSRKNVWNYSNIGSWTYNSSKSKPRCFLKKRLGELPNIRLLPTKHA